VPPILLEVKFASLYGTFTTIVNWTADYAPQVVEVPANVRTLPIALVLPNTGGPLAEARAASWPLAAVGAALIAAAAAFVFVARPPRTVIP
jgi:hypothetical protein